MPELPPTDRSSGPEKRYAGRTALIVLAAVAFLMVGTMLLALVQAPGGRGGPVAIGAGSVAAGLVLLLIARACGRNRR